MSAHPPEQQLQLLMQQSGPLVTHAGIAQGGSVAANLMELAASAFGQAGSIPMAPWVAPKWEPNAPQHPLLRDQQQQLSGNWAAAAAVAADGSSTEQPQPAAAAAALAQPPQLPVRRNRRKPLTTASTSGIETASSYSLPAQRQQPATDGMLADIAAAAAAAAGGGASGLAEADMAGAEDLTDPDFDVFDLEAPAASAAGRRGRGRGRGSRRGGRSISAAAVRKKAPAAVVSAPVLAAAAAAAAEAAAAAAYSGDALSDGTAGSLCGNAGGSGSGGYGDITLAGGDADAVAAAAASRNKQDRLKEKNRLAQRRFRARQKTMLGQMQVRMDDLAKQVEQGTTNLSSLRKENVVLRNIVQDQQKALLTAVMQQQEQEQAETQDTQGPDQQHQQQNDAAAGMPIGTAKQLQQLQELYQAQIRLDEQQQAAAAAAAAAAAVVSAHHAGVPAVPLQQWMLC